MNIYYLYYKYDLFDPSHSQNKDEKKGGAVWTPELWLHLTVFCVTDVDVTYPALTNSGGSKT